MLIGIAQALQHFSARAHVLRVLVYVPRLFVGERRLNSGRSAGAFAAELGTRQSDGAIITFCDSGRFLGCGLAA